MKTLSFNRFTKTIVVCDDTRHIARNKDGKPLYSCPCRCDQKTELVYNSNIGAEDMYGKGSGNWTGD